MRWAWAGNANNKKGCRYGSLFCYLKFIVCLKCMPICNYNPRRMDERLCR